MDDRLAQRRGWGLCALSLVLVTWGSSGLYQGIHSGFTGGLYDPEYKVPGVYPGGLADRSGFKVGDRIISVDGTPVEQLGMESRWPRRMTTSIGQSRRFIVERGGERIPIDVVYPAPSAPAVNNRIGAFLGGIAFLACGLWAIRTAGTAPARTLAHAGVASGAAMAFGLGPNLGSWNGVQDHVGTAASLLNWILMLRFFMLFPEPKRISHSRLAWGLIYGVWIGLIGFLVAELIVHPRLYYTTGSVTGPLMLFYGILILAAILHTFKKTSRSDLSQSGMYLILGGLLLTFALTLIAMAASLAFRLSLPTWVSGLLFIPIPLTMALAVRRQARRHPRGPSS